MCPFLTTPLNPNYLSLNYSTFKALALQFRKQVYQFSSHILDKGGRTKLLREENIWMDNV